MVGILFLFQDKTPLITRIYFKSNNRFELHPKLFLTVDAALCEVTAKVAPKSPYNLASTTDLCKVGISTLHGPTMPTSPIVLIPSVETGLPENKLWGVPEDGLWLAPLIPVRPDIRAPGHCRLARADLVRAPEVVAIGRIVQGSTSTKGRPAPGPSAKPSPSGL